MITAIELVVSHRPNGTWFYSYSISDGSTIRRGDASLIPSFDEVADIGSPTRVGMVNGLIAICKHFGVVPDVADIETDAVSAVWTAPLVIALDWELVSSCDDAGNELASRLENPEFVRVLSCWATQEEALEERAAILAWHSRRASLVGPGCLWVRKVAN